MAQSVVFITGGNNGIGFETCYRFAQQSNIHVIMGSRSVEKGEKAIAELQKRGIQGELSLVQIDVTSDDSIATAVNKVTSKHGRVDTLLNNAGICPLEASRKDFRETLEVNVTSPAMVSKAFKPLLEKSPSPRIIYVSSGLGSISRRLDESNRAYNEDYQVYRISKAAINMLAACDAWQFNSIGCKVFSYCPGLVVSDLAGMRQMKVAHGIKGPEDSAKGMLAIHEGKQDSNSGLYLSDVQVLHGAPMNSW